MTKYNWQLFEDDAKDAIKSMKDEYGNGNYGNSAYCCQQGIEKIIKAVLLRNEISRSPRYFGHAPLIQLWNDMYSGIDFSKWPPEHAETIQQIGEIINDIFKKSLQSKSQLKTIWWKYSLGINLNNDENQKLLLIKNKITDLQKNMIELNNYISSKYNINKEIKQAKRKKHLSQELLSCIDDIKQTMIKLSNTLTLDEIQKLSLLSFRFLKLVHKKNPRSRDMKVGFYKEDVRPLLTMWTFGFIKLLLKVYSHEDIGRYSRFIDKTTTKKLYANNKIKLKELEDEAEHAFMELREEALSLS